jgi:hypothetical protein
MAGQEIGKVEGARLPVVEGGEPGPGGIELVTMRPRQMVDASGFEHPVEEAAGPTVGITDEDAPVSPRGGIETLFDRGGDQIGGVVERGGETLDVDPVE